MFREMVAFARKIEPTLKALTLSALVFPSVFDSLIIPPALAQSAPSFAWDPPADGPTPLGYKVYASQESGKYSTNPIGTTTELFLKTPTLPLAKWYFTATSYNAAGESEKSREVSLVTLAPPTNLRLDSSTNYIFPLKLVWDKSESSTIFGDVKYRVYKRNRFPETSTWSTVTDTMNTFYSAQILQAGQFVYRITALKGGFESSFSSNDINVLVRLAAKQE